MQYALAAMTIAKAPFLKRQELRYSTIFIVYQKSLLEVLSTRQLIDERFISLRFRKTCNLGVRQHLLEFVNNYLKIMAFFAQTLDKLRVWNSRKPKTWQNQALFWEQLVMTYGLTSQAISMSSSNKTGSCKLLGPSKTKLDSRQSTKFRWIWTMCHDQTDQNIWDYFQLLLSDDLIKPFSGTMSDCSWTNDDKTGPKKDHVFSADHSNPHLSPLPSKLPHLIRLGPQVHT